MPDRCPHLQVRDLNLSREAFPNDRPDFLSARCGQTAAVQVEAEKTVNEVIRLDEKSRTVHGFCVDQAKDYLR